MVVCGDDVWCRLSVCYRDDVGSVPGCHVVDMVCDALGSGVYGGCVVEITGVCGGDEAGSVYGNQVVEMGLMVCMRARWWRLAECVVEMGIAECMEIMRWR